MNALVLSSLAFDHGVRRPIADLEDAAALELTGPDLGLAFYRVSELETWELAVRSASATLATSPTPPDLVVYASDTDPTIESSLVEIGRSLEVERVPSFALSGHGCGNLGIAVGIAERAIRSGRHCRVLIVVAERETDSARVMDSGLSIASDGSASCIVSTAADAPPGPHLRLHQVVTRSDVGADDARPSAAIGTTLRLGEECTEEVLQRSRIQRDDIAYLIFGNYRIPSQHLLAAATGFPTSSVRLGSIAEYAHCFSADLIVTLQEGLEQGAIRPGDRVLVSSTGKHSWTILDLEAQDGLGVS